MSNKAQGEVKRPIQHEAKQARSGALLTQHILSML